MTRHMFYLTIPLVLLMAIPAVVTAETITAYFEDALGESTAFVDAYRGKAGDGWNGRWTTFATKNSGTASATVDNTNPLNGSGNYLSVTIKNKYGDEKDYRAGLARDYLTAGAIDFTEDFTVEYSIRIDGDDFIRDEGEGNDRVFFRIGKENYPAAQPEDCIDIYMRGDGTWRLMDGASTPTVAGFDVAVGVVYDVAVTVHVADELYDITINNTTAATSYTATGLAWRSTHVGLQPYIGFSAYETTDYQSYGFSVDNIKIDEIPVPEPTTLAMSLGLLLVGMIMRRQR